MSSTATPDPVSDIWDLPGLDPNATLPVTPLPGLDGAVADRVTSGQPAALPPPAGTDLSGRRLGAWTLLRKIGIGGMGEVWLAERSDGLYQARAAIKLLRSDLPPEHMGARFARERLALARLDHPAIARLLDAGVDQGRAFIVLEYVQGLPLADYVRHHCPDVASRVRLMIRVAEAVDHAHARLVVHRDLKPANVLVSADGAPKLLDFGIAGLLGDDEMVDGQLTRLTGRRVTVAYAAPEQLTGEPVGVTADVFSLGVLLFQLLSGEMPFGQEASSRVAAEHALLHQEAPRLARMSGAGSRTRSPQRPVDFERVRGDLEAIVAKALRKRPADRYSSTRVLIDDLERWLGHRPVSVRGDDWQHRVRLWLRRNAWAAGAATALALALSIGLAVSLWQWQRAEAAARASDHVTAYLSDLLKSASPDTNGGAVPTVTQLLETSRQDLATRFADDPATLDRLTEVLSETYVALNRSDLALPLARQRVELAAQVQGPDGDRSLLARLELARILSQLGAFDEVVALAEPLRQALPRRFGVNSDRHRTLLYLLAYGHGRLGHFDQAEAALAEAGRVTEAMFPPGDFQRVFHLNHVQVLLVTAGRLREGLAALQKTEAFWDRTPPDQLRSRHTLERNLIAVKIRLGDYGDVIERGQDLLPRIDALMGPGSDQATGLRAELARALSEMGRFDEAWLQRKAVVDTASTMAARSWSQALPARAQALLARALAQPEAAPTLRQQARALLAELQAQADQVGLAGTEARAALLRASLVLADLPLALQTLASLRGDPRLARHLPLQARVDQLEAALARWQGDLPRSRELQSARVDQLLGLAETRTPGTWSAQLDLACTLIDQRDPAAGAVLQRAALSRPDGMPAQVPLDLLQRWLQARQLARDQTGDAPAVRQAWEQLARRVGQPASAERAAVLAAALL